MAAAYSDDDNTPYASLIESLYEDVKNERIESSECEICLFCSYPYCSRGPYLLKCGHTCCKRCWEEIYNNKLQHCTICGGDLLGEDVILESNNQQAVDALMVAFYANNMDPRARLDGIFLRSISQMIHRYNYYQNYLPEWDSQLVEVHGIQINFNFWKFELDEAISTLVNLEESRNYAAKFYKVIINYLNCIKMIPDFHRVLTDVVECHKNKVCSDYIFYDCYKDLALLNTAFKVDHDMDHYAVKTKGKRVFLKLSEGEDRIHVHACLTGTEKPDVNNSKFYTYEEIFPNEIRYKKKKKKYMLFLEINAILPGQKKHKKKIYFSCRNNDQYIIDRTIANFLGLDEVTYKGGTINCSDPSFCKVYGKSLDPDVTKITYYKYLTDEDYSLENKMNNKTLLATSACSTTRILKILRTNYDYVDVPIGRVVSGIDFLTKSVGNIKIVDSGIALLKSESDY